MKQKLNKKIIIPAVLIGGGIALYFLNKSGKLDKLKNLIKGTPTPEIEAPTQVVINPGTTTTTANPLGNAAAVKKFQEYYNRVRPIPFANLVTDGIFGPLTSAAYNSYKDQYLKFLQVPSIFTNGLSEKKNLIPIYQFQTQGGRKFNIKAETQEEAEKKATNWQKKYAPNSYIIYNFRVD